MQKQIKNDMKKIAINIFHNGINYTSNYSECDEKKELSIDTLLEKVAGGETKFFSFESGNKVYYFPEKVLSESIMSMVYAD